MDPKNILNESEIYSKLDELLADSGSEYDDSDEDPDFSPNYEEIGKLF